MLNFFFLQTAEEDAVKWSEKQKIEYTANTPPGAKKGDWLAVTGVGLLEHQHVYLLCISSDFVFPCRHHLAASIPVQSRVCGVKLVSVVGERGILQSRATREGFRTEQHIQL